MDNKEIVKKEDNILNRIINYFKKLFYKPKNNIEDVKEDTIEQENNNIQIVSNSNTEQNESNEFLESLKVQEVVDYFSILTLQNKFENGEIGEEDLTDEEYDALCQRYIEEIEELKIKINNRKLQLGIA